MIGIDEVGRGAWAGPLLVVAARQNGVLPGGVADSKKLTKKQRSVLIPVLKQRCDFGEGWVSAAEVDAVGLASAMRLGVARALEQLQVTYNEAVIMDGPINYLDPKFIHVTCMINADALQPIVSAASVYAKETRDDYMRKIDTLYPGYGFASHVGYGTKAHHVALQQKGATKEHRTSYKPVAECV
jgi:ribonuclease HII